MPVLQVESLTIHENGRMVLKDISFTIREGEQWSVTGPSGSGKTTLLHALTGRHAYSGSIVFNNGNQQSQKKVVMVEQQHRFKNLSNTNSFYYQQRYNSYDAEDAVTVEEELKHYINANRTNTDEVASLLKLLHLHELLPEKLIQLSNGENKRLQLAKAMLLQPGILLLDNPFIGLDAEARTTLTSLLQTIHDKGIPVLLVTTPGQIPEFVTHVLSLEKEGGYSVKNIETFRLENTQVINGGLFKPDQKLLKELTSDQGFTDFEYAVKMKMVKIRYNDRYILDGINWEVKKGERWSLSGPNGAGKSTLLSLITADNPQAYANEIYLFDRRRGSGESIWDIKKRIGFVSPELHLYFDTGITCFDVVASGLFDTIGLFRLLTEAQAALVIKWMNLLQLQTLRNKLLSQLSASQQRLVLLARALIKNPPLLILDEPSQGLDDEQVSFFKAMVDEICRQSSKTLIYVSHYSTEIPACVDKFLRLENGRIKEG